MVLFTSHNTIASIAIVSTIQKHHQYIGIQDGGYLVRFGMVGLFGFGMPFKIRAIQKPNLFGIRATNVHVKHLK